MPMVYDVVGLTSLAHLFRSLVDDPSFHQSVTKLGKESTPYFNQFHEGADASTGATFAEISAKAITDVEHRSQSQLVPEESTPKVCDMTFMCMWAFENKFGFVASASH